MLIKVFYVLSMSVVLIDCAKLLRTPKVYNALITTDENLTPSRAFPIIQPVIQPAIPIFGSFYPSNIFDQYNRNDVNDGGSELKNEKPVERKSDEFVPIEEPTNVNQAQAENPQEQSKQSNKPEDKPEDNKSPIPLNEYGFPPSLIPLQKFPTYSYNSYPFIYDSYGNFQTVQQYPVLAPNYYPQQEHQLPTIEQPLFQVGRKLDQERSRDESPLPVNENSLAASISNSNAFKNNGNTNSNIPDAEIPPVPFSIKKN